MALRKRTGNQFIQEDSSIALGGNFNVNSNSLKKEKTTRNEDDYIRFDAFIKFIVEYFVDSKLNELEGFYTTLKIKNPSGLDSCMSYDYFSQVCMTYFPERSFRWVEIAFKKLIEAMVTSKTPLNRAIVAIVPYLFNDNIVHPT